MDARNRAEPDTADQFLHEQADIAAFEARRTSMQQVLDDLDEIQVRAVSDNGLVEVTVDADGTVTRTQVAAEAVYRAPAELESAFTEAARAAGEAARERRVALLAPLVDCADLTSPIPDASSPAWAGVSPRREGNARPAFVSEAR